jgi:hypothetical protein
VNNGDRRASERHDFRLAEIFPAYRDFAWRAAALGCMFLCGGACRNPFEADLAWDELLCR